METRKVSDDIDNVLRGFLKTLNLSTLDGFKILFNFSESQVKFLLKHNLTQEFSEEMLNNEADGNFYKFYILLKATIKDTYDKAS